VHLELALDSLNFNPKVQTHFQNAHFFRNELYYVQEGIKSHSPWPFLLLHIATIDQSTVTIVPRMASRNGALNLSSDDRAKLLLELKKTGEIIIDDIPNSLQKELESVVRDQQQKSTSGKNKPPNEKEISTVVTSSVNDIDEFEKKHQHLLQETFGTGCLCCGEDDDHANLLLCEFCNAEYHTYCCEPPLRQVPTGDWYCSSCTSAMAAQQYFRDEDGLDRLVSALSPTFTSRFGEICWAHGGVGFGWWPGFIYDPRYTVGSARELAHKHLGKRHLVYFFECHDAPFAVLTTSKLAKWEEGLMEDYHMGKTAKSAGKARLTNFQQALQAATLELAKPIEMRLDWNHSELPHVLPMPQREKVKLSANKNNIKKRRRGKDNSMSPDHYDDDDKLKSQHARSKLTKGFPLLGSRVNVETQSPIKRNLTQALGAVEKLRSRRIHALVESAEDMELFIKLLHKPGGVPLEHDGNLDTAQSTVEKTSFTSSNMNVGFFKLPSRKTNTFADARSVIQQELVPDGVLRDVEWRFYVPGLGPVSSRQEATMGPMFGFLQRTTLDSNLGDGTSLHPLKIFVVECKKPQKQLLE
jgi:hypothetical protein